MTLFLVAALVLDTVRDGGAALLPTAAVFDGAKGLPGVAVLLATLFNGDGLGAAVRLVAAVPLVSGLVGVRVVVAGFGLT